MVTNYVENGSTYVSFCVGGIGCFRLVLFLCDNFDKLERILCRSVMTNYSTDLWTGWVVCGQ